MENFKLLKAIIPKQEKNRVKALIGLNILDTLAEERFDRLTRMAQRVLNVPIALVSLLDSNRQWFKSCQGFNVSETNRDISFCSHAILDNETFVIPDTWVDPRFFDNPLVIGEPHIRFYAGQQLKAKDGSNIGTLCVIDNKPRVLSLTDINFLQDLAVMVENELNLLDSVEIKENQLKHSEDRFHTLVIATVQIVWTTNSQGEIEEDMPSWRKFTGQSLEEIRGWGWINALHPEDRERATSIWRQSVVSRSPYEMEYRIRGHDDTYRFFNAQGVPVYESDGTIREWVGTCTDITERKQSELELNRLNRALLLRSSLNEMIIQAKSEIELINNVCKLTVDIGDYVSAWVGYARNNNEKTVEVVAVSGTAIDYIKNAKLSWSEHIPEGLGPTGRVIRESRPVMYEDITKELSFSPWLKIALESGFKGILNLPLIHKSKTFGVLGLFLSEICNLSTSEIELLQSMADDVAYGILALRVKEEQQRIQSAIVKIAESVSEVSENTFFEKLALNMSQALTADGVVILELLGDQTKFLRSIVAMIDGKLIDQLEYDIEGTVCEITHARSEFIVEKDLGSIFPKFSFATNLNMEAYVGCCLTNSVNQVIGIMYLLFRHDLEQTDFILSTLKIFATRAAAELERKKSDLKILHQASLIDKAQDAIIVRNMDYQITYWNKSAERIYGWTAYEAKNNQINEALYHDVNVFFNAIEIVIKEGHWHSEVKHHHKDGRLLCIEARWSLVCDDEGKPQSILSINTDITARKLAESKIHELAFYDELTKLPNRQLLVDRLKQIIRASERNKKISALLFIDLDNFKKLNDTHGHNFGDLQLQQVAIRLTNIVREEDTVARLSGDEFIVIIHEISTNWNEAVDQAKKIGEKILESLSEPYKLNNYVHHSSASIGVTLTNPLTSTVEDLLKEADLAMYQAKGSNKNGLRFFDPEMKTAIISRHEFEADLRDALAKEEFIIQYQPQIDQLNRVIGLEALIYWQHPIRGVITPLEFIPIAEETRQIIPIGLWVLETVCKQMANWSSKPQVDTLLFAINVSVYQFRHPDFVEQVINILQKTGANPINLKLELTESVLADNLDDIVVKMNLLKSKGITFSLDDFGTGYSSLSYLKKLPLNQLKIDQSFIKDILTDSNDASIAKTIVALAKSLELEVIAEGVETEEQRNFLYSINCNLFQGFLYSKPLPIHLIEEYINKSHAFSFQE